MVLAAWLAWGSLPAAAGEGRVPVPGTSWTLAEAAGWTDAERLALAELVPKLPASYADPGVEVRVGRSPAPPLVDGGPHTLGSIRALAPEVTLAVAGLETRLGDALAEWVNPAADVDPAAAATYLLQRAMVHELTHLVDRRHGLSRRSDWAALSGWGPLSWIPTPMPRSASGDFAAPWGARSPAEDLATFAEVYFLPPPLGPHDADLAPRCRFPTKFAWFRAQLDAHPEPSANVECSGPADVGLASEEVGEIHVLWASPTVASLAAVGGHLLLAVELGRGDSHRWDTFAMLADSGKMKVGTAEFAIMGLAGGFASRVTRAPYETTRFRYVEAENRDLLRFRLVLDQGEKEALLARLDDIAQHWRRPYLFFQQNCSALLLELVNVIESRPIRPPPVVPPDLVLAELARRGRIEPVPVDPSRDLSPSTRARLSRGERAEAAAHVCGEGVTGLTATRAERRDAAYAALAVRASSVDTEACWSEVARVMALSVPLEAALRPPLPAAGEGPPPAKGRSEALAAVRDRVPREERQRWVEAEAAAIADRHAAERPTASASQHTPYIPVSAGALLDFTGPGAPLPMVYVHRTAIDLRQSEPRQFGPARGIDLRLLDTLVALAPVPELELSVSYTMLSGAWHPTSLVAAPRAAVRMDLVDGRLATATARGWVRWAGAAVGATLVASPSGGSSLDGWLGPELRTHFSAPAGEVRAESWLLLPLRLELNLHPDAGGFGVTGETALLPALSPAGGVALGLESRVRAWVGLGHVGNTGVKLEVGGEAPWSFVGAFELPPPRVLLGLRLERW